LWRSGGRQQEEFLESPAAESASRFFDDSLMRRRQAYETLNLDEYSRRYRFSSYS
jgi:hypothetical protein